MTTHVDTEGFYETESELVPTAITAAAFLVLTILVAIFSAAPYPFRWVLTWQSDEILGDCVAYNGGRLTQSCLAYHRWGSFLIGGTTVATLLTIGFVALLTAASNLYGRKGRLFVEYELLATAMWAGRIAAFMLLVAAVAWLGVLDWHVLMPDTVPVPTQYPMPPGEQLQPETPWNWTA